MLRKRGVSRKFGKIAVYRGWRQKPRFVAVNGKNRDIAHTATNYFLCRRSSMWISCTKKKAVSGFHNLSTNLSLHRDHRSRNLFNFPNDSWHTMYILRGRDVVGRSRTTETRAQILILPTSLGEIINQASNKNVWLDESSSNWQSSVDQPISATEYDPWVFFCMLSRDALLCGKHPYR